MTLARRLRPLVGAVLVGGLLGGCGGVDETLTAEAGTADVSGLYAEPASELPAALTVPGSTCRATSTSPAGRWRPGPTAT